MRNESEIFSDLSEAVLSFDGDKLTEIVKEALAGGMDPVHIIQDGLTKALKIVGDKFASGEFFLMHLVAAAEPVQRVIKEYLEPEILKRAQQRKVAGRVVLGTVSGDIHDIGKNIVGALLFAAGFEIFDLGKDVPTEEFVKKAKEVNADIVGASALLSTSIPMQGEIVKAFEAEGLRNKIKLIFGGAPVTAEWVKEIGGDGTAENAVEAVRLCKQLLNIKESSN